jgi:hypothetical protein
MCIVTAIVFSVPYIPMYLKLTAHTSQSVFISRAWFESAGIVLGSMINLFEPWQIWLPLAFMGFFGLAKAWKKDKAVSIMTSSLYIVYAVLPFTLFSARPTRALYFLYIPVILSFTVFLREAVDFIREKSSVLKRTLGLASLKPSVFQAVTLLLVGFLAFSSFNQLSESVEYYNWIGDEEIAVINWVKDETADNDVLLVKGADKDTDTRLGTWIQAITERYVMEARMTSNYMSPADPVFSGQKRIHDAFNILAGNYILENGNLRVADSFPINSPGHPKIAINVGDYQDVLCLDDIHLLDDNNTEYVLSEAEKTLLSITNTQDYAEIKFRYGWSNGVEVVKTVSLKRGTTVVDISFSVNSLDTQIQSFNFDFHNFIVEEVGFLTYIPEENTDIVTDTKVEFNQNDRFGKMFHTSINIIDFSGNSNIVRQKKLSGSEIYVNTSEINFTINNPIGFSFEVKVRLEFSELPFESNEQVEYYNATDLIKQYEVKYVIIYDYTIERLDKNIVIINGNEKFWLENVGYYNQVYDNGETRITIYKVITEAL